MEEAIEKLTAKINFLDHHFEHELETVEDGIKTMNKKIESRETKSENRLDNLELVVKKEVEGSISDRLASLEHVMKGNLDRKLNNLESKYDQKITTIESTSKKTSGGGFQILFFLALILLGCSFVGLYFFYKQHVKVRFFLITSFISTYPITKTNHSYNPLTHSLSTNSFQNCLEIYLSGNQFILNARIFSE